MNAQRLPRVWAGVALMALALAGCGQDKLSVPKKGSSALDGETRAWDLTLRPTRGFNDLVLAHHMNEMEKIAALKIKVPVIFLNFEGAVLERGVNDAWISCMPKTTIPKSSLSEESREALVTALEAWFSEVGAKVDVVTVKPPSGFYSTIHFATTLEEVGCEQEEGYTGLGAARVFMDRGNLYPSDQAMVFVDMISDARKLPAAVAHVAGHMLGAAHSADERSVMSGELGFGARGFEEGLVTGGAYQEPASLPGMTQLVTLASLLKDLPENQKRVDLSRVQAELISVLPKGVDSSNLDKVMTVIKLAEAAAIGKNNGAVPEGASAAVDLAGMVASILTPAAIPVVAGLDALAKMGGFSTLGDAFINIINWALGQAGVTAKIPPLTSLPAMPTIFGVQAIASMEELIQTMNAQALYLAHNVFGENRASLQSLLRVTYGQVYEASLRGQFAE